MKVKTPAFFILLLFFGCQSTPDQTQKNELTYFDLKGYFAKESLRLSKAAPLINKTVMVNGTAETKEIRITDWTKELEIFKDADINKSAWKALFKITKTPGGLQYTSNNDKVPVKKVSLFYKSGTTAGDQLKGLEILVWNTNLLYNSTDTLIYYPDSLYQVKKSQNILFLSPKNYQITGKFK